MLKLVRHLILPLCLAVAPLSACQTYPGAPTPTAITGRVVTGAASLSVRPTWDGYHTQSAVSAYTKASIAHLLLKLYVVTTVEGVEHEEAALEAPGQPIELDPVDLDKDVTFSGLKPNTTYRVKAFAYKAAGRDAADLISATDADSAVTIALTDENRPTASPLKVRLVNRAVSMKALGADFVVDNARSTVSIADQQYSKVAYNSQTHETLVVWQDYRDGLQPQIYGRLIGANGFPHEDDFVLGAAPARQLRPVVAYNEASNDFLVVWLEYGVSDGALYGRRVSAAGVPDPAGRFRIGTSDAPDVPAIAYNSTTHQCLVTWSQLVGLESDLYGQCIGATGTPAPAAVAVLDAGAGSQFMQQVAYDGQSNEWLLVWKDSLTDPVSGLVTNTLRGRRVSAEGQPVAGDSVVLADNPSMDQDRPLALAYNRQADGYLLAWNEGANLQARRLTGAGAPNGEKFLARSGGFRPDVAASAEADEFLLTCSPSSGGIRALRVGPAGTALPSEFVVNDSASSASNSPAAVYDGEADAYVVSWSGLRSGSGLASIFYARVGPTYTPTSRVVGSAANAARQSMPSVAYAPAHHTYLSVWGDGRQTAQGSGFYARFLNDDGTPASDDFLLFDGPYNELTATVVYNATDDEFLVIWKPEGVSAFYTMRVGPDGARRSEPVTFSIGASLGRPAIAYNRKANEYFATWQDLHSGKPVVYGQRLNADGTAKASAFALAPSADDQDQPSVAYDAVSDTYLVAWVEGAFNAQRACAVRLTGAGAPEPGGAFPLTNVVNQQVNPVVAASSGRGDYLVVWRGAPGLIGQRVGASGVPDPTTTLSLPGAPTGDQPLTAVGLPATNEFLVVWSERPDGAGYTDLYGMRLGASGPADPAASFVVCNVTGDQTAPAVACNGQANQSLVLWQDDRNGLDNPDIRGRRFDSYLVP